MTIDKGSRDDYDLRRLTDVAVTAALKAGAAIMDVYGSSNLEIESKADDSPVTVADLRADAVIKDILRDTGLPVLSEEGRQIPFGERKAWGLFWLVDPLDGTKEFIDQSGEFTVNIALMDRDTPVAGVVFAPVKNVLYIGITGQGAWKVKNSSDREPLPGYNGKGYGIVGSRSFMDDLTDSFIRNFTGRYGDTRMVTCGSSLKFCMIAEGEADIYPRFSNISEWDTAAGHAIVLAAGGYVVQALRTGQPLIYNKPSSRNPWFIAYRDMELLESVKDLIPGS